MAAMQVPALKPMAIVYLGASDAGQRYFRVLDKIAYNVQVDSLQVYI